MAAFASQPIFAGTQTVMAGAAPMTYAAPMTTMTYAAPMTMTPQVTQASVLGKYTVVKDSNPSQFKVTVVKLETEHGDHGADWFVKLKYHDQEQKTSVKKNAGHGTCHWNESFIFDIEHGHELKFEIEDEDRKHNDHLGKCDMGHKIEHYPKPAHHHHDMHVEKHGHHGHRGKFTVMVELVYGATASMVAPRDLLGTGAVVSERVITMDEHISERAQEGRYIGGSIAAPEPQMVEYMQPAPQIVEYVQPAPQMIMTQPMMTQQIGLPMPVMTAPQTMMSTQVGLQMPMVTAPQTMTTMMAPRTFA